MSVTILRHDSSDIENKPLPSAPIPMPNSIMKTIESDSTACSLQTEDDYYEENWCIFQELQTEEKYDHLGVEAMSALSVSPSPNKLASKPVVGFEIQILSDIHTEFLGCDMSKAKLLYSKLDELIIPSAKYLALLGDIGCPGTQEGLVHFQEFLSRLEGKFEHIFLIAGNHEYYSRDTRKMHMNDIKQRIRKYCDRKGYVTFLDKSSVVLPSSSGTCVRIIGTTLWSEISRDACIESEIIQALSDFRNIYVSDVPWDPEIYLSLRPFTAEDCRQLHKEELEFIISEVSQACRADEAVIVLTHHAPSFKGTSPPEYSSGPLKCSKSHPLSTAFASELDSLFRLSEFQNSVYAWAYGHTHYSNRQLVEGIQLVSNQVGYMHKHESCSPNPSFTISI